MQGDKCEKELCSFLTLGDFSSTFAQLRVFQSHQTSPYIMCNQDRNVDCGWWKTYSRACRGRKPQLSCCQKTNGLEKLGARDQGGWGWGETCQQWPHVPLLNWRETGWWVLPGWTRMGWRQCCALISWQKVRRATRGRWQCPGVKCSTPAQP